MLLIKNTIVNYLSLILSYLDKRYHIGPWLLHQKRELEAEEEWSVIAIDRLAFLSARESNPRSPQEAFSRTTCQESLRPFGWLTMTTFSSSSLSLSLSGLGFSYSSLGFLRSRVRDSNSSRVRRSEAAGILDHNAGTNRVSRCAYTPAQKSSNECLTYSTVILELYVLCMFAHRCLETSNYLDICSNWWKFRKLNDDCVNWNNINFGMLGINCVVRWETKRGKLNKVIWEFCQFQFH